MKSCFVLFVVCGLVFSGVLGDDCTAKAQQIMKQAQTLINDGIDYNNEEMQASWGMMPEMPGMDALLQKHFKFTSIVSCKNSQMDDGTQKIKLEVTGTQEGDSIEHNCSIVLGKDDDSMWVIQNQCQGQN